MVDVIVCDKKPCNKTFSMLIPNLNLVALAYTMSGRFCKAHGEVETNVMSSAKVGLPHLVLPTRRDQIPQVYSIDHL